MVISSLTEPPYAERHVRWCERGGLNHPYSIIMPVYIKLGEKSDRSSEMLKKANFDDQRKKLGREIRRVESDRSPEM